MHTNNEGERDLVERLINCSLEINLIAITLINIKDENEKLLGKGVLRMRENGRFYLKFFNNESVDNSEKIKRLLGFSPLESPIYRMEGLDHNSMKYSSGYLSTPNAIFDVIEFEVSGKIHVSSSISNYPKIIFSGQYQLPMDTISNSHTYFGDQLWYTDHKKVWHIELEEGLSILFCKFNKYTEAILIGKLEPYNDEELLERVISSFDFITGKETEAVLINTRSKGYYLCGRRNMLLAQSTFEPPLPISHSRGEEFTAHHSNLFKSYFHFIATQQGMILPDIHKRIVSSSRGYIFSLGLVVSIQVENICKLFYSQKHTPNEEYFNQVLHAIEILEKYDKKEFTRVIDRLKSSISQKGRRAINVRSILKTLCKEKLINEELLKSWVKMRNSTAHGENMSNGDWTHFLNEVFLCINLYYALILNVIGYKGMMRYYNDCHNSKLIQL